MFVEGNLKTLKNDPLKYFDSTFCVPSTVLTQFSNLVGGGRETEAQKAEPRIAWLVSDTLATQT